jgi:glycosyltransferase involved in cell wall biosynthesis
MSFASSPIEFAMMGDGDDKEKFTRKIKELGLEHRVNFRGWGKPQDVADFLRSQDVSLLLSHETLSWREQFGRVIIESQSCGVPVVGAATGAIPNVIGKGGWIVPQKSPKVLAGLFDHLFENPDEIAGHGAAGIMNVASRFTYEKVAEDLGAAWREANAVRSGHEAGFAKAYRREVEA